jgi:uncharacterized protein
MKQKITTCLFLLFSLFLFAQKSKIPNAPFPPKLVNNLSKEFPNFLTSDETQKLEEKLVKFAKETTNQIVIVIVDDLAGLEPWTFATELGQKWKVGTKGKDNGIVVLIKPTNSDGGRKYHIAIGYGLEGAIPDLTSKRIQDVELLPNLKNGKFYDALHNTTDVLMALAKGEYDAKEYNEKTGGGDLWLLIIVFFAFILFFYYLSKKGGTGGKGGSGSGWTMGHGAAMGAGMGAMMGGGGSSSGGFGGFGGGSFGGGGSGGSW